MVTAGPELRGERVVLVRVTVEHVPELRRILGTPEVRLRWGEEAASSQWPFDDPSASRFAVLLNGAVCGMVQYGEEEDPAYRHASIDIFLDPTVHGRGLGRDAVATLARHLVRDRPGVFTPIFMIMVSASVRTVKSAPELGGYGLLRTVSAPRKGHLSGEGYKEPTQGGGAGAGLVGQVVGRGRWGGDGGPGRGGAAAAAG